jgi:hypothetical protein
MGARERSNFELTLKGTEELSARTYRLDARARNILFLIQRGYPTVEGILENTIFPRDEVVDRLRDLLRAHFVTLQAPDPAASAPTTIGRRPGPATLAPAAAAPPAPPPDPETEQPDEPIYFGL